MVETAGNNAAAKAAMGSLEANVRAIVRVGLEKNIMRDADTGEGVAAWHDRVARCLHETGLKYGTDAMKTAASYAIAALEGGLLYPGEELETFIETVAGGVRQTSRELSKGVPFGA
ncbi:MAG: hypothetical protein JWN72_1849 [Thermoleophilia bacterium]|nr:hypothetical protein [Thermoleophilia bacterium]